MVFLLLVEGFGIERGPTTPQLQDGAGPVMKPEMWMWLVTPAGNNGLSHCSAFFPLCFSSQVCFHIMYLLGEKKEIQQNETKHTMQPIFQCV